MPWFNSIRLDSNLNEQERNIAHSLFELVSQTQESIRREVDRINFILDRCRFIFIHFLSKHCDNLLLARFLYDQNTMVCDVFQEHYQSLIHSIYGAQKENLYLFAGRSLREGGRGQRAQKAVQEAFNINPQNSEVEKEKK